MGPWQAQVSPLLNEISHFLYSIDSFSGWRPYTFQGSIILPGALNALRRVKRTIESGMVPFYAGNANLSRNLENRETGKATHMGNGYEEGEFLRCCLHFWVSTSFI